jgi:hypothetical protein
MIAPPGNANARWQPGERVIKLAAKLRMRVHHVKRADRARGRKAKYNPIAIGGALQ